MNELTLCLECRGKGRTFYYSMTWVRCKRCGGVGAHPYDQYPRVFPDSRYYTGKVLEEGN